VGSGLLQILRKSGLLFCYKSILLFTAYAFFAAACATTTDAGHITRSNDVICGNLEYLRDDIKKLVLPANISVGPSSGLQILDNELASHFDLINAPAIEITGNCAKELDNFQIGDLLDNFQIRTPTLPSDRNYADAHANKYEIEPPDSHPLEFDGDFMGALSVGGSTYENGIVQIYLGLWQNRNHSIVGFFTKDATGTFSEVKPLLKANPRLRLMRNGITLGCPGGRLSLFQEMQNGLRIYSISHQFFAMYSNNRGTGNCTIHPPPAP